MSAAPRSSSRTVVVHQRVPIEVTPLPFVAHESVRNLDLEALSRVKKARLEVGHFDAGCCQRTVCAIVRNGKLTSFEVEPCDERAPMPPSMKSIVDAAYRDAARRARAATHAGGLKLPVPVEQLPQTLARIKATIWVCVKICIFGHCLICCIDANTESPKPIWGGCGIDRFPTAR